MTKKKKNNNTAVTIYSILCFACLFMFLLSTVSNSGGIATCSANGWSEGAGGCFNTAIMSIFSIPLLSAFIVFLVLAIVSYDKTSGKETKSKKTKKPNNSDDDYDDGL